MFCQYSMYVLFPLKINQIIKFRHIGKYEMTEKGRFVRYSQNLPRSLGSFVHIWANQRHHEMKYRL